MIKLPVAQVIHAAGTWSGSSALCSLTYEQRFFRRKRLDTDDGWSFVADFEHTVSLNHGDALELADGRLVEIVAAAENLLQVQGDNLQRLAWHIGNRHTPCQIEATRLMIQNDAVIRHMLEHLGATISERVEPFMPEGGAYGHGRTHSHDHGHSAHVHSH